MEFSSTIEFADAARRLGRAAVGLGLVGPSFRSPPRLVGVDRTIRRRSAPSDGVGGDAVVSVRVRGRRREAVMADMIEGVVATNALQPPEADRIRNALWDAMSESAMSVPGAA